MKRLQSLLVCLLFMATKAADMPQWSWLTVKNFTAAEREENGRKESILFSKNEMSPFNQLLFSWNAHRPKIGFLRFKVQVYNQKRHHWERWLTMLDWGATLQRSYKREISKWHVSYHHVRLEMPKNQFATAVRVRVEAHDGAQLSDLVRLAINTVNNTLFTHEQIVALEHLPSYQIVRVPARSQMVLDHPKKEVICSPTSCSMVGSFLSRQLIDPVQFAQNAYDDGLEAYGSWPFNTAHLFETLKGRYVCTVKRLHSFKELYQYLRNNIPVVVSVRGPLVGAASAYAHGHLLVVTGWDREHKKIICNDPAFDADNKICVSYDAAPFIEAWERSRRLAYVCGKMES